ncbi:MAG: adenylyl-sulfate kinase [Prosthecobacter sp.]|uniref:adenylyl-sulfate kinase n=1 Tax=Prosthecobacter sp. TaxID=1965333 RepID=UPI0019F71FAD|nr:adenylyl-sulfate kinase [Prosthecobacter sp.]MBE2284525.1 adenylyl-sulfate kinase [Prosthecobacter sp.]
MHTEKFIEAIDDAQAQEIVKAPVIWLYGLSGAGKTTLAQQAARQLRSDGRQVVVLDGDELRAGLCRGLGYTEEGRLENVRRAAELARLLSCQGVLVLVALMTPQCRMRELAGQILGDVLTTIHLRCDHAVCAARDVKGLYRQAASGQVTHLPGCDMVFEEATNNELSLDTGTRSQEECLNQLWRLITK